MFDKDRYCSGHAFRAGNDLTAKTWIIFGLAMATLNGGCSTFSGYPQRIDDTKAQLQELQQLYFGPNVLQTYEALPTEAQRRAYRDRVINGRILAIDDNYQAFVRQFSSFENGSNLAFDAVVLGTSGAAALSPALSSAQVLSAISAGFTGFRTSVDKNLFYQKTWPVLVSQMEALRLSQLAKIRSGLQLTDDQYPLTQGLVDLEGYFMAGTLPGAISGVATSSGQTTAQANQELKAILAKRIQPKPYIGPPPRRIPLSNSDDDKARNDIRLRIGEINPTTHERQLPTITKEQATLILNDCNCSDVVITSDSDVVLILRTLVGTLSGAKLKQLQSSVDKILSLPQGIGQQKQDNPLLPPQ